MGSGWYIHKNLLKISANPIRFELEDRFIYRFLNCDRYTVRDSRIGLIKIWLDMQNIEHDFLKRC